MKLIVPPFVALVTVTAATVAFMALGHTGSGAAATSSTPQHVTLQVVTNDDQLVGRELVVRPGLVVLVIKNYARHAHLFSVPGLGVNRVVLPGSPTAPTTTVIRFRAPLGVFTWYCKLPCERTMTGDVYVIREHVGLRGPIWSESAPAG